MIPTVVQASSRRGPERPPPAGLMTHTTGRTILEVARKKRKDPESFVVRRYASGILRPCALIGYKGTIYLFQANDLMCSAHAAWYQWERDLYEGKRWARRERALWARDYRDDVCGVQPTFYLDWFARWQGEGRDYRSPIEIVEKVGGPGATPNRTFFGAERLATPDGVSTPEQDRAEAWLFVTMARKHGWFDPAMIAPDSLPQPWYLGHSDVNPARRWARVKGSMAEGFAWDPGTMVDWSRMGELVVRAEHETAPRPGRR